MRFTFHANGKLAANGEDYFHVEAPSFYVARALARVRFLTDEVRLIDVGDLVYLDAEMRWVGSDFNSGGVRRLLVRDCRRRGARWERAQL